MWSIARLLLWVPATTAALELCMDRIAPLEPHLTHCCDAAVSNADGHFCCESGTTDMWGDVYSLCFDEGDQLFWRTFNRSTTFYHAEWHLAAQTSKPGSYYTRSAKYFAEPDHPRLNYAKTEITVSPSTVGPIGEDASVRGIHADASQPLSVPVGAEEFELCMDVVAPIEPDSKPCCHALSTNEDGHWCCESGSLRMCLDESTQTFWRTFNRSTTFYYHEWYVAAPTSNQASYYTHASNYFAEPDHPRLNYARTAITVTPVGTHSQHEAALV
jgi:hypothetical protein